MCVMRVNSINNKHARRILSWLPWTFCAFCMAACTGPSLATTFSCALGSFTCVAVLVGTVRACRQPIGEVQRSARTSGAAYHGGH